MKRTAGLRWIAAILLLSAALLCPFGAQAAARTGAELPVHIAPHGGSQKIYTVEITAQDNAPLPDQTTLQIKSGEWAVFTGFAFDEPGDYRYTVRQHAVSAEHLTCDGTVYTVTMRVTGRQDGSLSTEVSAVKSGETAKSAEIAFVNRYDPPSPTPTPAPTASPTPAAAQNTVRKTTAIVQKKAPALPQTGDEFPFAALAAMALAGLVGFGTAWRRR